MKTSMPYGFLLSILILCNDASGTGLERKSSMVSPQNIDEQQIRASMQSWADAFSADTPDTIVALYADDAVLWGTLSPTRRDDPAAIRDYFAAVFPLAERKVEFMDPFIRVYGNTAINSGRYTFTWVKAGEVVKLAARYSFTYVKRDERWLIVDHHSSRVPEPGP